MKPTHKTVYTINIKMAQHVLLVQTLLGTQTNLEWSLEK